MRLFKRKVKATQPEPTLIPMRKFENVPLISQVHVCGLCLKRFDSEEHYLNHVCSDGMTPKEPR